MFFFSLEKGFMVIHNAAREQ